MTKHTPATPLPWHVAPVQTGRFPAYPIAAKPSGKLSQVASVPIMARGGSDKDAAYIAHAANAYPKLVEALRAAATVSDTLHHLAMNGHLLNIKEGSRLVEALLDEVPAMYERARNADALLRSLGEE
jgi:hypothetical protein